MAKLSRKQMEMLNSIFDKFALGDQRNYYRFIVDSYKKAAAQVNFMRAFSSLIAGLSAALAGLIVQSSYVTGNCTIGDPSSVCTTADILLFILMLLAVLAPAIGGALTTLADLYQWDRLITVYDDALKNLALADARSPDPEMDDETYRASLAAFSEGTLNVMFDESGQWGQMIRTPKQIEDFLSSAQARVGGLKIPDLGGPTPSGGTPSPNPTGNPPAGGD